MSCFGKEKSDRITTWTKSHNTVCSELSLRTDIIENPQLHLLNGGLVVPGPQIGVSPVIAATWKPSMNAGDIALTVAFTMIGVYSDEVKSAISSGASAVGNAIDHVGDMVSDWWDSGSNTSLDFGNGYY